MVRWRFWKKKTLRDCLNEYFAASQTFLKTVYGSRGPPIKHGLIAGKYKQDKPFEATIKKVNEYGTAYSNNPSKEDLKEIFKKELILLEAGLHKKEVKADIAEVGAQKLAAEFDKTIRELIHKLTE